MKLNVERDALADAVATAAKATPTRPSVPILAGVKLTTTDDGVTVSGFDYEVSTQGWARGTVTDPGTVVVAARLLAEITKSLPQKPVGLASVGTHLELVCGSARFTLPTMPVEDYPQLPDLPATVATADAAALAQAIAQVGMAAGRDETLPMMTGVRLELRGNTLSLLATDRYRLAHRDITITPTAADLNADVLVPARVLTDTAKTWGAGTVDISYDPNGFGLIGFAIGHRKTTSRLLDGANYPPVRSLFPATYPSAAVVPVASLIEVVKRVALVAERTTPVLLTFTAGDNGVVVEAGGQEEARASEALEIGSYAGQDTLTIGFNPQYLIDGLHGLGTATAHIGFVDAFKPAVISPADEEGEPTPSHRYLIMPIRVSR
ncbi:DNA polymerase III subunit beta [Micromonospora sp. MED01]|uniref:DNA polymerase III subunit beta n=1 Tax=Micromonospora alfalfae TaxID=2911212 RepID=UPI001EE796B5|nr:DNA polymerase III subunit beta [Micromonospora alfalfae]MCG5464186.1 DNA polymerase III subunit beta [Micromonospora alfalfae]